MKEIGFIGFGNMGSALGLALSSDYQVYYNDLNKKSYENVISAPIETIIEKCECIILAVKPHQYEEILSQYDFSNNLVISIAAGITSKFMKRYVKKYILTMPNTPALIKQGYTAIVKNEWCDHNIETIFAKVGNYYYITEEQLAEAICLTGSSPAYFFNFIDKLASSFENLNRREVELILANVMKSAANMIIDNIHSAETLTSNVCSPNGTTIQAVEYFNTHDLEAICNAAINACYQRAKAMEKQ